MSSVTSTLPAPRMAADDRRESILHAATAVFGAKTYAGTTTDDVARAAGVSQPYVVRLFGTKQKLFLAVLDRALVKLFAAFRAAVAGEPAERTQRMGDAYIGLLAERGLLQSLSAAFLLGGDSEIGPAARGHFADVWRFLRTEVGMDAETAQMFLAQGMLINTLVGLRVGAAYGEDAAMTELLDLCIPEKVDEVLIQLPTVGDAW
ncbi:TetR/AcrR family transcriptional regulator [Naasia lichenicola]|uniref:TetR/AcrR family transcriptional regulator n=1 Tax=Naasia lichenicola TaxID=2565933 RepID=A0A4S4FGW5_9MICO|nr:helix-turn-helix domain-containing protein [Naasia lichenicola]THG29530.1 TetR/AcrR family transcriptional regulator [Naasia lichenicola]